MLKSKVLLSLTLSALMAYMPTFASANGGMIATTTVVENISREQAQEDVESYLAQVDVQNALMAQGVSAEEVKSRLASLSQQEMAQLSGQIQEARAGGILVTILVVVLIIFLIQRI